MSRLLLILLFVATLGWAQVPVTVAWDANTETNLAGYRIYWGKSTRFYTDVRNCGDRTQVTIPLYPSETYYIAVTAYNTEGIESDYSSELVHVVRGTATAPIAPRSPRIISVTSVVERASSQIGPWTSVHVAVYEAPEPGFYRSRLTISH
jgi:hypothetical protein